MYQTWTFYQCTKFFNSLKCKGQSDMAYLRSNRYNLLYINEINSLFWFCIYNKVKNLIAGIINGPIPSQESSEYLEKYKWIIDNKYYKAEIYLCKLRDIANCSSFIFDCSEAVIFYIDTRKVGILSFFI